MDEIKVSEVPNKYSVGVARQNTSKLFRPKAVEAGRSHHHRVNVRTKCWHTRPIGKKRQNCDKCASKLSGVRVQEKQ